MQPPASPAQSQAGARPQQLPSSQRRPSHTKTGPGADTIPERGQPGPVCFFFSPKPRRCGSETSLFDPFPVKTWFQQREAAEPICTQGLSIRPSVRPRVLLHSTSAFLKPGVSFYVTKLGFFLLEFLQAGNFIPNRSSEITPKLGACWRQGERRGAGRPGRTGPYFQAVFQVLCLDTAGARGRPRAAQAAPAAPAPYWGKMKELEVPV